MPGTLVSEWIRGHKSDIVTLRLDLHVFSRIRDRQVEGEENQRRSPVFLAVYAMAMTTSLLLPRGATQADQAS